MNNAHGIKNFNTAFPNKTLRFTVLLPFTSFTYNNNNNILEI